MVRIILHIEGAIFLLASLFFYQQLHGNWLTFMLLLFSPDIAMIGYLKNKKWGATIYNLVHNYVLSFVIIVLGYFTENTLLMQLGFIVMAHVGLDRLLGYGLKYPDAFKHTHLQEV